MQQTFQEPQDLELNEVSDAQMQSMLNKCNGEWSSDKISGLSNPPSLERIEQRKLLHGRVQLGKEVFSKCHHWELGG